MKRHLLLLFLSLLSASWCRADINTDKAISKISRDIKTYLSAVGRADTEQEAYDMAMNGLSSKIAEYYKAEFPSEPLPDAIYLSNLSSIYDKLTSRGNSNRYRVLLYIRKSDVKPLGDSNGTVLSRNETDRYEVIPTTPAEPTIVTDTVTIETVTTVVKPLTPILSTVCSMKTRDDVLKQIPELKKADQIGSAAAFPIQAMNDLYIIIISPTDDVKTVLHYDGKEYSDILNGETVDISTYSDCSAFWFTLPQ